VRAPVPRMPQTAVPSGVLNWQMETPHSVITRELGWEELRWAVARCLDAELIHPVAKRVWMKA